MKSLITSIRTSKLAKLLFPSQEVGGLEITDEMIKMVFLEDRGNGPEWKYFCIRPLPVGLMVNGIVKQPIALSQQIKQAFSSVVSKTKLSKKMTVVIPESLVYVQSFNVPATLNDSMVTSAIINSPSYMCPYDITDVNIAWQPIFIKGLDKKIIVGAAKKTDVLALQNAVEQAGLDPIAMQTPTFGFEFFVRFPEGIYIAYFIEKEVLNTTVYVGGKLSFKSTRKLTACIKKTTIELEDVADFIEKDFPKTKDFILSELGEDYKISLGIAMSYYEGADKIVEILKGKNMQAEVVTVGKMNLPKTVNNISSWLSVVGAAARGMVSRRNDYFASFLSSTPREIYIRERKEAFFSRSLKIVATTVIFYMVAFSAIGFFLSSIDKERHIRLVNEQKVQLPAELVRLDKEISTFNSTVDKLTKISATRPKVQPPLDSLKKLSFEGISFIKFNLNYAKDKVEVTTSGSATTREKLIAFKKYMEEQGIFKDIKIPPQALEQRENINFTLAYSYVF